MSRVVLAVLVIIEAAALCLLLGLWKLDFPSFVTWVLIVVIVAVIAGYVESEERDGRKDIGGR